MTEVKHVYTAIANVLKDLSVEKGGTLPSNMGGKAYITAHDAAAEVKRQFVANDLIFIPNETVIHHENMIGDRTLKVSIVVTGTYTIISTVDGSSVEVSGTGDGLANGTAVASNIASTNAFKNALLRTFMITEQSVEDAGKDGPAESKTPAALASAKKAPAAAVKAATSKMGKSYDVIKTEYLDTGKTDLDTVKWMVELVKRDDKVTGEALYAKVLEKLEAGVEKK